MPSHRQGLTTQDKPLSGEGGVLTAIIEDLSKLEFGTYVVAESTPLMPDDGTLWFTPSSGIYKYWSASAVAWKLVDVGGAGGLAAHIAATPIDHPDASVTAAKLASNAVTAAKIASDAVTTVKILDANVTAAKLAAGAATDTVIGNRTVDQTLATPANTGILTSLLSWIVGRLKAITGEADWKTAPQTTLAGAKAHADSAAPHSGHQTPAGSQAQIDAHAAAQGAHGLYSGSGSPETVVTAPVGSLYRDTTNGRLYVKRTGVLAVGWGLETNVQSFARVRKTGAHATINGTNYVSWTTELDDTDNIWAIGAPTRFVVPAGMDGRWRGRLSLSNMETPQSVTFRKNGTTDVFRRATRDILTDSVDSFGSGSYVGLAQYETTMKLAATDYIEVGCVDTGTRSWDVEEWLPMFEFEYLGPTN